MSSRVASVLLLLTSVSTALAIDAPKAVFPEPRFSFGAVRQGTAIEHEYVLRNEGDTALRILGIRTNGPLMLGRMSAQLASGREARFRVRLDTSQLNGHFQGEILVSLNDPVLPEVSLLLEGRVVPPIELSPRPAFFVAGQRGTGQQSSIDIISHESEPLEIESVEHPVERFTTKLETIEEGRRYRLSLVLAPDGPAGKKADIILIKTSSRTIPVLRIPANTLLRERVYTFPDTVDLGSLRLADIKKYADLVQRTAQTLMVYQPGGTDFQARLRTDLPMLELKSERGAKGDRYQSTVKLVGEKLVPGPIRGSIVIDTNDPEFPTLTVPVHGEIR